MFCETAKSVRGEMEPGPERASCLRFTLIAKDAAVRGMRESLRAYDVGTKRTIMIYVGVNMEAAERWRDRAQRNEAGELPADLLPIKKLSMEEAGATPFLLDVEGKRMSVHESVIDRGGWGAGPRAIGGYDRVWPGRA